MKFKVGDKLTFDASVSSNDPSTYPDLEVVDVDVLHQTYDVHTNYSSSHRSTHPRIRIEGNYRARYVGPKITASAPPVPWSGKFFVGDQFESQRQGINPIEITACKVGVPDTMYDYTCMVTGQYGNLYEAQLLTLDLIGGPSFKQAGQLWQAQYMQQPPNTQSLHHTYDVGDRFKIAAPTWQVEIEIIAFAQGFSDPHYEAMDIRSGARMIFSEDSLNAKGSILIGTRSKAKAQQSIPRTEGMVTGKSQLVESWSNGDGTFSTKIHKPHCAHNRKYINGAGDAKFWVCPDCKADLGDA